MNPRYFLLIFIPCLLFAEDLPSVDMVQEDKESEADKSEEELNQSDMEDLLENSEIEDIEDILEDDFEKEDLDNEEVEKDLVSVIPSEVKSNFKSDDVVFTGTAMMISGVILFIAITVLSTSYSRPTTSSG